MGLDDPGRGRHSEEIHPRFFRDEFTRLCSQSEPEGSDFFEHYPFCPLAKLYKVKPTTAQYIMLVSFCSICFVCLRACIYSHSGLERTRLL